MAGSSPHEFAPAQIWHSYKFCRPLDDHANIAPTWLNLTAKIKTNSKALKIVLPYLLLIKFL